MNSKCEGGECVYGNDVDRACNNVFVCSGGRYELSGRLDCSGRCPTDFGEITVGGACKDATMACTYLEGTCACLDDGEDAGDGTDASGAPDAGPRRQGHWKCVPPPESPACPLSLPPVESECVKPMTCDYGSCELSRQLTVLCTGAMWVETAAECR